jgi:hypothetical protein
MRERVGDTERGRAQPVRQGDLGTRGVGEWLKREEGNGETEKRRRAEEGLSG